MHREALRECDGFAWRRRPSWRGRAITLIVLGVVVAGLLSRVELPIIKAPSLQIAIPYGLPGYLAARPAIRPPKPLRNPLRGKKEPARHTSSNARVPSSRDFQDRSSPLPAVQRPAPWVVKTQ